MPSSNKNYEKSKSQILNNPWYIHSTYCTIRYPLLTNQSIILLLIIKPSTQRVECFQNNSTRHTYHTYIIRARVYYRHAFVINIIARLFNFPYERISHQSSSYSVLILLGGEASFVKISLTTVSSLLYAQRQATLRSELGPHQLQGKNKLPPKSINFSMA